MWQILYPPANGASLGSYLLLQFQDNRCQLHQVALQVSGLEWLQKILRLHEVSVIIITPWLLHTFLILFEQFLV